MSEAKKAPWTPEDVCSLKWVDDVAFSQDGRLAAFTVREVDRDGNRYRSAIWIVKTATGRAKCLTHGCATGDTQPAWAPDSRRLAFTSSRNGKPQVFMIDLRGGEAWQVTSMARGAHSPAVSPDGKKIAFVSAVNEEERVEASSKPRKMQPPEKKRLEAERKEVEEKSRDPWVHTRLLYRSGREYRDGRWAHVFAADVKPGSLPVSLTSGEFDHSRPVFHPDGKSVFTLSDRTGAPGKEEVLDLLKIPVEGGGFEFALEKGQCVTSFDISQDGRLLAYTAVPAVKYFKHAKQARVRDLNTGEDRAVSDRLDTDVDCVRFGPNGENVFFLAPLRGDVHVYSVPAAGGDPVPVFGGKRQALAFDVSRATGDVAFAATAPDAPSDLFLVRKDGSERRITELCKSLISKRHMALPEEVLFEGHEGLPVQGWLMKSRDFEEGKPGKLAVELHGGPHIMWGNSFWHEFQVLASAGYSVFFCNPRGSEGYGLKFKGMLYRNWGVDDAKDVLAGADLMVKRGIADTKSQYVLGGSYGGYLTAWIVTHDHRFRAAVAQRGVYNLVSIYNGSDAQCLMDWEYDTAPWDDPELLLKSSPIRYAGNVKTPTMIKHSDCDYTATISSAEEFYNALKKRGVDTVLVRYPREGHELSRSGEPEHRVDRLKKILWWFETH